MLITRRKIYMIFYILVAFTDIHIEFTTVNCRKKMEYRNEDYIFVASCYVFLPLPLELHTRVKDEIIKIFLDEILGSAVYCTIRLRTQR